MIDTIFPLRDCELLSGLNDEELSSIAIICSRMRLAEGDRLFLEGQAAERIYIVTDGRIALHKSLGDHRTLSQRGAATIAFCCPDEIVGWSALVEPYRYTLSATAWEQSQLLVVRASLLRRAMELNPDGRGLPNHALPVRSNGPPPSANSARPHSRQREFRNGANTVRIHDNVETGSVNRSFFSQQEELTSCCQ